MPHIDPRCSRSYVLANALLSLGLAAAASAQTPVRQGPLRHAGSPSVSPDGRHVLFSFESGGRPQPHVMDADGTNQRALLPLPIAQAAWFPDGKRLLTMQATDRTSPRRVVLMNLDGSDSRDILVQGLLVSAMPLGDTSSILVGMQDPSADRSSMPTLRIVRLDASVVGTIAIPAVPGRIRFLRPSRDGRRIAFVAAIRDSADISPMATKSSTLYVMNIDGSALKAVATFPNLVEGPSWSYDGARIALQNDLPHPHDATGAPLDQRDVDGDIIIVVIASGAVRELKHSSGRYLDETPDWSPDGRIYFQSNRDGIMEIYRMNADGTNPQRLTK